MSNVIDHLPVKLQDLFATIIGDQDKDLLSSLRAHRAPDRSERIAVERILAEEFSRNLDEDDEPTQRGKEIDDLLGAFLLRWPINPE